MAEHGWISVLRLSLSVILYILLFYSIFDVYYTSPLVHGIVPMRPSSPPLSKTVIFIVADGLRADKLFTRDMVNTPTLKNIILNKGSWGLSHTRVPTESRPGHVALFAGFYEDVASVTKGWQTNAVEFDSIFNRSHRAWLWGGPDVVPIFQPTDRISDKRVFISSYPNSMLDFTAENITQVDNWVVDHFTKYILKNSHLLLEELPAADGSFRKGNFIFLHLSAADQLGHTAKPDSPAYDAMIRNLDSNVARIVEVFARLPSGDHLLRETTFIFTADHGMTNWGSHGAGSIHETVTPLILWGKNVPLPRIIDPVDSPIDETGILNYHYNRAYFTVRQADLCPLVAALLGVPIPANSVGEIPLDLLDISIQLKTELARANALQILAQYQIKYDEQKASHYRIFFREYRHLTQENLVALTTNAAQLTVDRDFLSAIAVYKKIVTLGLNGLSYYHKYDRFFMGLCIALSYAFWSVILVSDVVGHFSFKTRSRILAPGSLSWAISAICLTVGYFLSLLSAPGRPWLRTVYQLLPLILGTLMLIVPAFRDVIPFALSITTNSSTGSSSSNKNLRLLASILLLGCLLELALWGFIYRPLLSLGALLLGFWPLIDPSFIRLQNKRNSQVAWFCACFVLSLFPLFPVVGSFSSPFLVLFSGIMVSIVSACFMLLYEGLEPCFSEFSWSQMFLSFATTLTGLLVYYVRYLVAQSETVPFEIHCLSWALLIVAPYLAVFCVDNVAQKKLTCIALACFIPFNLMNLFYEGCFFLVLGVVSFMWAWFESGLKFKVAFQMPLTMMKKTSAEIEDPPGLTVINFSHIRQPIFYMFFLIFSFFGTGNIASVNTFDPISLYCFMTVLNPAVMGPLLIFKMLCPMIMVGAAYAAILRMRAFTFYRNSLSSTRFVKDRQEISHIHTTILLVVANFLAVHFFMMLRDEGSWLDIGESISHYVIAMSIGLASLLLAILCGWLLAAGATPSPPAKYH